MVRHWWPVLKRTVGEFREDNLTDWAAALTYYAVLAIFPALIVLVSILGLVGESATQPLIDNLGTVAPGPAKEIFTSAIENLQGDQGAAGVLFVVGLLAALWSASGYVAAFMRASNAIYDIEEGRPIWKTLPVRVGLTHRAAHPARHHDDRRGAHRRARGEGRRPDRRRQHGRRPSGTSPSGPCCWWW